MSFETGETGIERDETQLVFAHAPKLLHAHQQGGPDRVVAVSVPGTPVVVEYVPDEDPALVVIRSELLTEDQVETLEELLSETGPVTVKLDPAEDGETFLAVFGPRAEQKLEPIFGAYPVTAPERLTKWRAQLTLYRQPEV